MHAKKHGLPVCITFLDLRNAFGSISHRLIVDMLEYVHAPSEITRYICNAYIASLQHLFQPGPATEVFPIQRGVFQGDILSPTIFLLAFNPIVQLIASNLEDMHFPNSVNLPPISAYIYVEWDENDSNEPPCRMHGIHVRSQITFPMALL